MKHIAITFMKGRTISDLRNLNQALKYKYFRTQLSWPTTESRPPSISIFICKKVNTKHNCAYLISSFGSSRPHSMAVCKLGGRVAVRGVWLCCSVPLSFLVEQFASLLTPPRAERSAAVLYFTRSGLRSAIRPTTDTNIDWPAKSAVSQHDTTHTHNARRLNWRIEKESNWTEAFVVRKELHESKINGRSINENHEK